MRALVLLLAVAVIALSASIILRPSPAGRAAPTFDATRLIADAQKGETATYRNESGTTITYVVDAAVPAAAQREPRIRISVTYRDRLGAPLPNGFARYDHLPARHGLFPLMAPMDPEGYDRVWVWERIRRAKITFRGREQDAWRFDLIDPALRSEGGADHVVAWLDDSVPVFGLLRFQRGGHTWDLISPEERQ